MFIKLTNVRHKRSYIIAWHSAKEASYVIIVIVTAIITIRIAMSLSLPLLDEYFLSYFKLNRCHCYLIVMMCVCVCVCVWVCVRVSCTCVAIIFQRRLHTASESIDLRKGLHYIYYIYIYFFIQIQHTDMTLTFWKLGTVVVNLRLCPGVRSQPKANET